MRAVLSVSIDISWKQVKKLRPLWSDDLCRQVFKSIAASVATHTESYAEAALEGMVASYDAEEEP